MERDDGTNIAPASAGISEELAKIVPVDSNAIYDMHKVIEQFVDDGDFFGLLGPAVEDGASELHDLGLGLGGLRLRPLRGLLAGGALLA